ncbi:plant/protein [Thalictrum thalictroides]|uniref:Plant/protein n=1 Tax=Thalictrum thalictroides TaxID=46969 RepID=A0A7J6WFS0_THATH|nr:plant/protein [Thalictrum thalictroides]
MQAEKKVDDGKETVTFRMVSRDEEGQKKVEKKEVESQNPDTLRYIDKKNKDKGMQRMDRHPVDGRSLNQMPKSGRGGKFTWEGPDDLIDNELDAAPAAIDEGDPNYVDEEGEERIMKGEK